MLDLAILVLGGILLYFGAEWLIAGAAGVARRFGASERAVGLTVVSYGTSAPSLSVSLAAAHDGRSPLVLGNVIGGNILTIGLALGLTAWIAPPRVNPSLFRREVPYLLIATLAAGPILLNQRIDRAEAALFLISALVFTAVSFHRARQEPLAVGTESTSEKPPPGGLRAGVLTATGVLALFGGGRFLVQGAVGLARDLGLDDRVMGLTVVALGSSTPLLVTALGSAMRGASERVVQSVVGTTSFNLLFVLGLASLVFPIEGRLTDVRVDLVVMTLLTFLMALGLRRARSITRPEGLVFLLGFVGFVGWSLASP